MAVKKSVHLFGMLATSPLAVLSYEAKNLAQACKPRTEKVHLFFEKFVSPAQKEAQDEVPKPS